MDIQSHDYPGKILAMPFDLSQEEAVEQMLSAALDIFGHVDVLVNNIYHWTNADFNELTDEHWREAYEKNVLTSFHVCRAVARLMEALNYGKIINVTSTLVITGRFGPMGASCAGVNALTKAIAHRLAPYVRANTIACGVIEEEWMNEGERELKKSLIADIPLKRLCQGQDVAELVAFLATGADFMTGQLLVLDGGENG